MIIINRYNRIKYFVRHICLYPETFCSDTNCEYFVNNKCIHPEKPNKITDTLKLMEGVI